MAYSPEEKKQRAKEAKRKWRDTNPEEKKQKALEATRRWRAANPDRANELARASQKKWRAANPEKHRAWAKEWKRKNYSRYIANHTAWRKSNRDHVNAYRRAQHYKQTYGMTIEERDKMLAAQGGVCAASGCNNPGNKAGWVIDHCHDTGRIRGILCQPCNLSIGFAQESAEKLRRLAMYIEASQCQP